MKNNRQIGLNGRNFISSCLKRCPIFVLLLMLGGIATAVADVFKLVGASGAVMGTFTTTLLVYDFICSLLLVVVVFYAYFLECGDSIPVLRHKPILWFGCARLGYLILLSYYICYRALYCLRGLSGTSPSLCIFYFVYFIYIFLCILANCFVFNILTRNIIRRSYIKSFHALSSVGLVVQVLLPVAYIIARVTMKDNPGDEYFTTALCDMLRLCVCPICTAGLWLLFVNSISQVSNVFNEVDTALRERRYQITYTSPEEPEVDSKTGKKLKKFKASDKGAARYTSTAFLPTPVKGSAQEAAIAAAAQRQLPAAKRESAVPASDVQPAPVVQPTAAPQGVKKLPPKPVESKPEPEAESITAEPAAENLATNAPVQESAPQTAEPVTYSEPVIHEFDPYPEKVVSKPAQPKKLPPRPVAQQKQAARPVQAHVQQRQQPARKPAAARPVQNGQMPRQGSGANVQNNYRGKNAYGAQQSRTGMGKKR